MVQVNLKFEKLKWCQKIKNLTQLNGTRKSIICKNKMVKVNPKHATIISNLKF